MNYKISLEIEADNSIPAENRFFIICTDLSLKSYLLYPLQ